MAGQIKVTTETLHIKCGEWMQIINTVKKYYLQACGELDTLSACFDSQVAVACTRTVCAEQEKGEVALNKVQEQIEKLNEIATVYEMAEKENIVEFTAN